MNATTIDCDQTEEETLNLFTYEVSDEALEAAAGGYITLNGNSFTSCWFLC